MDIEFDENIDVFAILGSDLSGLPMAQTQNQPFQN